MKDAQDKKGCLVCGQTTPKMTRQLCSRHYIQFDREKKKLPPEMQKEFEKDLIKRGLILPPKPAGRPRTFDNPFAELAQQYQTEIAAEPKEGYESERRKKAKARKKSKTSTKKSSSSVSSRAKKVTKKKSSARKRRK